jgi:hypothetical protein
MDFFLIRVERPANLTAMYCTIHNFRVAVEIVKICYEVGDWEGLNSNIVLISKRRQQLKQVLVEIVQASFLVLI